MCSGLRSFLGNFQRHLRPAAISEDAGKRTVVIADKFVVRVREEGLRLLWIDGKCDQLLWIANRQIAQQHRVNQRENRSIGSDPEREQENRDQGESGILIEDSNRMSRVLDKAFERPQRISLGENRDYNLR